MGACWGGGTQHGGKKQPVDDESKKTPKAPNSGGSTDDFTAKWMQLHGGEGAAQQYKKEQDSEKDKAAAKQQAELDILKEIENAENELALKAQIRAQSPKPVTITQKTQVEGAARNTTSPQPMNEGIQQQEVQVGLDDDFLRELEALKKVDLKPLQHTQAEGERREMLLA